MTDPIHSTRSSDPWADKSEARPSDADTRSLDEAGDGGGDRAGTPGDPPTRPKRTGGPSLETPAEPDGTDGHWEPL